MLRADDFGAALVEIGHNHVAIKSLVGEERAKRDAI
jgi:hypothetical protein